MISIVVPVYNASKYLKRCIDSILNQTVKDIELLLIDDESHDNSLEICNNYKNKDKRVKVYHHKNKGVAMTRNDGIKYANGEYIMFIDNDDYIANNYIEEYLKVTKEKKYDVVIGGYERIDSRGKILKRTILKNTKWSRYMIVSPWAKLYRLSFLKEHNIDFLNSNIGEDIYFNVQVVNFTKNIRIIDNVGYKWFYNDKSISNTVHKKVSKDLQFEYLLDSVYNKIKNYEFIDNNEIEYFFIKTICWYIFYIMNDNTYKDILDNYNYYFNWLKLKFPYYYKNKYHPLGENLKVVMGVKVLVFCYHHHLDKTLIKLLKHKR